MKEERQANLELQIKVSKILSLGFAFSLIWLAGFGSLFAFILGLKARRIIKESNGQIAGLKMAWWCIIVGAIGMVTLPLMILSRWRQN